MHYRNNKRQFYILLTVTVLWTGFIWAMSFRPAEDSSEMSMGIVRMILNIFLPWVESVIGAVSEESIEWFHFFVRKCAHFTEYLLLGILSFLSFRQLCFPTKQHQKLYWLIAVGYCTLIASADETIQLFVEGRSGQLSDVMLDCTGAICGILLTAGFLKYKRFKKSI